jgi:transmembrane sensor
MRPLAAPTITPDVRSSFYLSAGQSLDLNVKAPAVVRTANVLQSSAWRYGRVVLDNTRLDEAAADLNRYGGPQIVLADPRLGDIRISGVFHTGRPYDVVREIVSAFPIKVASDDGQQIVLAPMIEGGRAQTQGVTKSSR